MSKDTGTVQFKRGYVYLGGQMLAMQDGAVVWVHTEPVTKGQRLTDTSGQVVGTVEVDPWGGETLRMVNSSRQPRKYTTYERDANGGDEAMFRRYEGRWQRFVQPDPYDGSYDLSNPQSFNRYAYVQNDPVNFTDPTGLTVNEQCPLGIDGPCVIYDYERELRTWVRYARARGSLPFVPDVAPGGNRGGGGGLFEGEPPPAPEPRDFPCPPSGEELVNHPGFGQLAQSANQYARSGDRGYVEAGGWILMNRKGDLRWQIKTREPRDNMTNIYGLGQPQNYSNVMGNGWIVIADFHTHVNELPNEREIGRANRRGVPGIWIYPSGKGEAYGPESGLFGRALPEGC